MSIVKTMRPYHEPAGGGGGLRAIGTALIEQDIAISSMATLSRMNQSGGFECPGVGWAAPKNPSPSEYCENGGKAVAWEATTKRCAPEFFAFFTVSELEAFTDFELEIQGRLTHPMRYDAFTDTYVPVSWDDAFAIVARHLNALPDPNMADFYTSGRASNEASFFYQLFAREYGTNNVPECSDMCHEAISGRLPQPPDLGKGTVLLDDFEKSDAIFSFGQNPGTNSPRMMADLGNDSRHGATITLLDAIEVRFGFNPPRAFGHNVVTALQAMVRGDAKVFIGLGDNFPAAIPNWEQTQAAMRRLDLTVHLSTKLNRSHLVHGREALILPCLGRTELDEQADGVQAVTAEDSMLMVHALRGHNRRASEQQKSELGIIAGMARATLGARSRVDWEKLIADYALIRDDIDAVFPIFQSYNSRIEQPGGFQPTSLARERIWTAPSDGANLLECEDPKVDDPDALWLTTVRSHDLYNTTLYSLTDRYRGVYGQRDVIFLNAQEMERHGLKAYDRVDIITVAQGGIERAVRGFKVVPYRLPDGSCAAYYAVTNPLMSLYAHDPQSLTPSPKGVPVRLVKSSAPQGAN